eukprot:TRINITY_DN624_c1_g2_i7.p1 TRINITY_DN624_c1_g2~~TRINITY_DN624_c1_g2_i7.p1  ORF type:complete len:150 (-),score=32.28 TRINITY_DN624_c1_g2_i7:169-618(-)
MHKKNCSAAVGEAAATAGSSVFSASSLLSSGALAASSAARGFILDVAKRPRQALGIVNQVLPGASAPARSLQAASLRQQEQRDAVLVALKTVLDELGVLLNKEAAPLLETPLGCIRFCELMVDILEEAQPRSAPEYAAYVQMLVDSMVG